jgi:hypothetical protein
VGRLGTDGFLMKGWALTVAGAFYGFAINRADWQLALASLFPTAAFWGLDAFFLRCERLFRCLYVKICLKDEAIKPFFMGATGRWFVKEVAKGGDHDVASWWRTVWSRTLLAFYGGILLAGLVVIALLI